MSQAFYSLIQFQDVPTGLENVNNEQREVVETTEEEELESIVMHEPDREVTYQLCICRVLKFILRQAQVEMVPMKEVPLLEVKLKTKKVFFFKILYGFLIPSNLKQ